MARQYANPSGLFGRLVTTRLLERSNRVANDAVFRALRLDSTSRLLEIGFGGGELLLRALESGCDSVHGVEPSGDMLQLLQRRLVQRGMGNRAFLAAGTIDDIPWETAGFDRVCSVNTVYFWDDLEGAAKELARVTRDGGLLVLGFSDGVTLRERGYEQRGFILHAPEAIHQAMDRAGFSVETEQILERGAAGPYRVVTWLRSGSEA